MGNFAEALKRLRNERGLTQAELAKALSIGKSTVSMYEVGKREPDFESLEAIADFFNVPMSDLLDWDNNIKVVISDTDPQLDAVIETAKRLNAQGLTKLGDYADDLAGNPQYAKKQLQT